MILSAGLYRRPWCGLRRNPTAVYLFFVQNCQSIRFATKRPAGPFFIFRQAHRYVSRFPVPDRAANRSPAWKAPCLFCRWQRFIRHRRRFGSRKCFTVAAMRFPGTLCPPIAPLPRHSLASSATGGASAMSTFSAASACRLHLLSGSPPTYPPSSGKCLHRRPVPGSHAAGFWQSGRWPPP